MSWFSCTEDYSIKESGFYGEPEITYDPKNDETSLGPSSTSGPWDDYQHERERIYSSCCNNHSR